MDTLTNDIRLRALIYARVSLDLLGEGRSVARQIDACRSLADARDYEVVGVETDTQSAYADKKRPGWERVKAAAERGEIDVIVSWQLDRITRSMRELEFLLELNKRTGVMAATVAGELDLTTANGAMIARILAAVARAESELKGARLRLANLDRAKRGVPRRNARPLFGYDRDSNIIETEARAIRRAAHDVLHGTATLTTIRRRWNRAGLLPHHSTVTIDGWSVAGVRELLINPRLAGLSIHHRQVVGRGTWQPIIRVRTHQRLVVRLVDERKHVRRPHGSPPISLLEGLGFCQLCGSALVTTVARAGRPVYRCVRHHSQIGRTDADEYVLAELARAWGMESPAPFDDVTLDDLREMLGRTLTIAIRPGRARDLSERIVVTRTGSRLVALTG